MRRNPLHYTRWVWPNDPQSWLFRKGKEILEWCQKMMEEGVFSREDYRELVELIVTYLGGEVREHSFSNIHTVKL